MRRLTLIAAIGLLGVLLPARPSAAAFQAVTCCFQNPEVALWDARSHSWYVSSYGGYDLDQVNREGDGFISKLSADGAIVAQKWVAGLDSPWDMDVYDGKLYAADIRNLDVIDIKSAKVVRSIRIPNANDILNGLAVDRTNGDVYVSGWTDDTIYKVSSPLSRHPKVGIFMRSPALETPNDMLIEHGKMIVTADGPGFFTTSFDPTQGRLLVVDMRTRKVKPLTARFGVPDGIEKFGRDYITDDYMTGRIFRVTPGGEMTTISQYPTSVAQISIDQKRKLMSVAHGAENVVTFETLP